jgi:hypothetical protein
MGSTNFGRVHKLIFWKHRNIKTYVSRQQIPGKYSTLPTGTKCKKHSWYGASVCGSKSNAVNIILRLFLFIFVPHFTYDELVTSRVHPQQHNQPTNTTTMVMELLAHPAVWI